MDYVKKILTFVRKYHFWVLAGVVLIVVFVFWSTASARLSQNYESRKSQLENHFGNMVQLAGQNNPANEAVYNILRGVHEQLQKNVMRGWRYLYEEQTKNNPLPSVLGEDFIKAWEERGPHDELPAHLIDRYWNFIRDHFPKLLERGDIRRPKNPEQLTRGTSGRGTPGLLEGGPGGTMGPEQIEHIGKVVWDKSNYDQLVARFVWTRRPTTREIRLAQEDLWVCETLLNIIKDLNKDSTSHYNASVKRIMALDIGPYATKAFYEARDVLGLKMLTGLGAAAGAGGMPGGTPGGPGLGPGAPPLEGVPGGLTPGMMEGAPPGAMPPGMSPGMMEGGMPGMMPGMPPAGTSGMGHLEALYLNRYIDQNEQPVPLENGLPKHPFSEFKMMPIRMYLMMDQRKISELLVRCANSNMPIEIRQVRLNPGRAAKVNYSATGVSTASMIPGMPGMMPGMEGLGPMAPGGEGLLGPQVPGGGIGEGPGVGPGTGEAAYRGPYDVAIEVLGIIYIYERPDESKLGTGTATTGETVPAAQPPSVETPAPGTPPPVPTPPAGAPEAGAPGAGPGVGVPGGAAPAIPPGGTTPPAPPGPTPPVPAVPPGTTPPEPKPTVPAPGVHVPPTSPATPTNAPKQP